MIAHLRGTVIALTHSYITLDVHGVGYEVHVTHPELYTKQQEAAVHIYSHWHTESGPQLFGFNSYYERQVFATILECQGVGPKLAVSILCQLSPVDFITAITLNNSKLLSSLKGIGQKKAETMILYLQDKIKKLELPGQTLGSGQDAALLTNIKHVTDALTFLSYSRSEITNALDFLKANATQTNTFDELMRKALAYLAKTKQL